MLSVEREFGSNTLLSVRAMWAFTQAHRLLVLEGIQSRRPRALPQPQPDQSSRARISHSRPRLTKAMFFVNTSGQTINGTRGPLGPNFRQQHQSIHHRQLQLQRALPRNSDFAITQRTPADLRRLHLPQRQDQSSNVGEEVNPIDPALSKALSAFDACATTLWSVTTTCFPFDRLFAANRLDQKAGRSPASLASAAGFPVHAAQHYGDNSLIGAEPNGH